MVELSRSLPVEVGGRASAEVVLVEIAAEVVHLPANDLLTALNVSAASGCGAVEVLTVRAGLEGLDELSISLLAADVDNRWAPGAKLLEDWWP